MACRWTLGMILSGLLGCALAQEVDLRREPKLQQPIRVWLKLESLRDALRHISQQTGVTLRCQDAIQHEKVAIFVENRPAHEILTQLAKTLRYAWRTREEGGYTLYVPDETRLQEERLARAEQEFKRKQLRCAVQIAREVAKLPLDEARRELSRLFDLLEKGTLTAEQGLRVNLLTTLMPREDDLGDGRTHYAYHSGYTLTRCLAALPESGVNALTRGEVVGFSSRPAQGVYRLPSDALFPDHMRDTEPVLVRRPNESGEEEETYLQIPVPYNPELCGLWLRLSPHESRIECALYRWGARLQTDQTSLELPTLAHAEHPYLRPWREWATPPEQWSKRLPKALRQLSPENPELTFPVYRWNALRLSPNVAWGKITCADALEWLAFTCRLPVVADAYRTAGVYASVPRLQNEPLATLRALSERLWLRFDESGYLLARTKDFWSLRRHELPEDWLRPLEQKYAQQGYLDWRDYIERAGRLTEAQARYLSRPRAEFYDPPLTRFEWEPMERGLPALRFLAALPKPVLERVLASDTWLTSETLTPLQQRRFAEAMREAFPPPEQLMDPSVQLPESDSVLPHRALWTADFLDKPVLPADLPSPAGVRVRTLAGRHIALEDNSGTITAFARDDAPADTTTVNLPEFLRTQLEQSPEMRPCRVYVRQLQIVFVTPTRSVVYQLGQPRYEPLRLPQTGR